MVNNILKNIVKVVFNLQVINAFGKFFIIFIFLTPKRSLVLIETIFARPLSQSKMFFVA